MPRRKGGHEVHVHIIRDGLIGLIEKALRMELPFCNANIRDEICLKDDPESLRFALCQVLTSGCPEREPNLPDMPEIVDADTFAAGIAAVAKWLAAPATDQASIDAGVYYAITMLYVTLQGDLRKKPPYRSAWFDMNARALLVEAASATTQDVLNPLIEQAKQLHASAIHERGNGTFRFFPSTVMQAAFYRDNSPVRTAVMKRLCAVSDDDGEFLRTDAFVQGIIDDETAKQQDIAAKRETINGIINVLLRQLGHREGAKVEIAHSGNGIPDLSKTDGKTTVQVDKIPDLDDTFVIFVSGSGKTMAVASGGALVMDVSVPVTK